MILASTFTITFQSQRVILGDALFSLSPSDLSSISFQDGTTLPRDATVDLRWQDLFPSRGFKGSFITAGFPAQLSHLGSEAFHGLVKDFRFSSPAFHWF